MTAAASPSGGSFQAPHPGSKQMPRWDTGELIDAPRFTWKNWVMMLGPGLLMGGAAIGGGEWLTGPLVTARYGGALLWLATLSILAQVVYNLELCRYTLYTGEPIFTGKFRTMPGPTFWIGLYLILDVGSVIPYLASGAATPIAALILGYIPDTNSPRLIESLGITDQKFLSYLAYVVFLLSLMPLVFGGKIYNSLKAVMSFKIVTVFAFLLVLGIFFSKASVWGEIFSGFFKFGNVPVSRGEDLNGNGILDPGEDRDGDGQLDGVERIFDEKTDGPKDAWPDRNEDGRPDKFDDVDADGIRDGDDVENIFVSLFSGRGFPLPDLSMLGVLCALIAISGQGGLSNTPLSNYTRDQGWGMGHHVGAIPSVVGGHDISLSHVGCVFQITKEALARWKAWYWHVARDQLVVWMPACFIGLGLPSMLSVQFLKRGTMADTWTAAGMTADGVREQVGAAVGPTAGQWFWILTLVCGFLVLAPTQSSSADGVIRRWVDAFWTALPQLRKMDTKSIRTLYFAVLCAYAVFGIFSLRFLPQGKLLIVATLIFNWAIGFSCLHTLIVNCTLLPPALRPGWFMRIALVASGAFFLIVAGVTTYIQFFPPK